MGKDRDVVEAVENPDTTPEHAQKLRKDMLHMCRYEDRYIRVHGGSVLILGSWAVESAALACVRCPLVGYSNRLDPTLCQF